MMKMKFYFLWMSLLVLNGCGGGSLGDLGGSTIVAPNLSDLGSLELTQGETISPIRFTNAGSAIDSCVVVPTLPIGLTLNSDCSITGTPTTEEALSTYEVTGSNTAGSDSAIVGIKVTTLTAKTVTVSGIITFDSVPFKVGGRAGLDYNNITKKNARGVLVEILDSANNVLASDVTDTNGAYSIGVSGTTVKVRVSAKLYKAPLAGQASWNFQVKDNTNSNALYVMEGSLASLGNNSTQTRNLNAGSGWGGSSYTSTRVAAPFAILDVVYEAIEKITTAQNDAEFGSLDIFWSKNNIATNGNTNLGQITTSHFNGTALYILGKENSDTDEYDRTVVGHEWGHYYESKFSRSDSIGGPHGGSDMLDIRLAFGEGFGTAIGCIIVDSNFYLDSLGNRQDATGVFDDLEKGGSRTNAGWYNEASIYSILYDIYDSNNDVGDTLSLGFTPIHNVLTTAQKNTDAFTSIFTFITALKAQNSGLSTQIDAITNNESIAPINDIYGIGRVNRFSENANPLYANLSTGGSINIRTDYSSEVAARSSGLGTYNFVKVIIPTSGSYRFNLAMVGGNTSADPDMYLYAGSSNEPVAWAESEGRTDTILTTLSAGTYRMAIKVYGQGSGATVNLTLN